MNRGEKHIKQSLGFAAAISAVAFIVFVARELVGFDKFNPVATPKTFPEVVADFPRLLGFTAVVFVGALWWKMSQNEKENLKCSSCKEVIEINKEEKSSILACKKCGGTLEELEGYYERHPEEK